MLRLSATSRGAPPEASPPAPGGYPSEPSAAPAVGRRAASPRLRGLFRSGTVRALAAVLVLAGLGALAAPQALAQTVTTLVSNTGQTFPTNMGSTVGTSSANKFTQAQSFRTGDNEDGYTLTSILIHVYNFAVSLDEAQVSIYDEDASGNPGSSLYTLTNPGQITNGSLNTFTAPPNKKLLKDRTYFVVVEAPSGAFQLRGVTNNAEDEANEWSIGDTRHWRNHSGSWDTADRELRIAVMGTIGGTPTVTKPGAPENLIAAVGDGEVTLSWEAPTETGGGEITGYQYRHAAGSTVPDTTAWSDVYEVKEALFSGLTNHTEYAFEVRAVNSAGGGTAAAVTATPLPVLSISDASFAEDAGAVTVTVTLSSASSQTVSVGYKSISDVGQGFDAEHTVDYNVIANTLTISAGDTSATIPVTIIDDDIDEGDEAFGVQLLNPTNVVFEGGHPALLEATVTITDDDTRGVTVSPTALSVPEGGNASYTVVLTSQPTGDVTVTPSLASGGDADLTLHSSSALTFTADNWDTVRSVRVNAAEDTDAESGTATITHAVAGGDYAGETAQSVTATEADNDSGNTPATGAPEISGTAQVGETLTASKGTIADTDGTADAVFTYEWFSVSGTTETSTGTTAGTYEPDDDDVGKTLLVKASFNDDAGNPEGPLASAATAAVTAATPFTCTLPALGNRTEVRAGEVTVGSAVIAAGNNRIFTQGYYLPDSGTGFGTLDPTGFTYQGTPYTIDGVFQFRNTIADTGVLASSALRFSLTSALDSAAVASLTLDVCGSTFALADATHTASVNNYSWDDPRLLILARRRRRQVPAYHHPHHHRHRPRRADERAGGARQRRGDADLGGPVRHRRRDHHAL